LYGLTGGIATGKSYIDRCFVDLGTHLIDADLIAREVVEPDKPAWKKIVDYFGESILNPDRTLDRKKLGKRVFANREDLKRLESFIHPEVFNRENELVREIRDKDPDAIIVVDAALMIESGSYKRFDKVILVVVEESIQLERLMNRDGISKEEAIQKISSQMPQSEKRKYADYIIDTSRTREESKSQVEELFQKL